MSTDLLIETAPSFSSSIPEPLQQRYTNWKKNTRLLYEYLNTNSTKWPSLTCQFMPDMDIASDKHRILLSSFTSAQLPEDEAIYISEISTMKHIAWSSLNNFHMEEMEFKVDNQVKLSKNLTETIKIQFPEGDCNRARYMPQNPDVIASASSLGSVYIFDRTKHGSNRPKILGNTFKYDMELKEVESGCNYEASSLAWNYQRSGILAASYSDGDVKIWDITKYNKAQPQLTVPDLRWQVDKEGANEVSWMVHHSSILAVCGEGNGLTILDTRTPTTFSTKRHSCHTGGINAVQFNYDNDFLLCSADSEGTLNICDIRQLEHPVKTWSHLDAVSTIQWNPKFPTVIASAGQNDGLVKIWDLAQEDDPLVFIHGGHMLGVNDIAWNHHDPWVMCSVSNDNSVHIWKPAANIVNGNNS
ncbi:Msi1p Ecym_7042 [Eremothecium cymbalariae DBVPG|uniref:Histone-binding protein RBBP4-like N-terminal domain-containing protein n=1 Tax=Eremothecium cymbalariae (strain CBS 270.75 / DBVPG 7215 / KCTC 17166 / NRRL Y-17582) TaxID=931890 RepID=G8JVN3_ERECY|nr:hypothetical protein Ecym_7042 [Eremothecium cymbalariae DBVPG\